jgi:hypothetical protein
MHVERRVDLKEVDDDERNDHVGQAAPEVHRRARARGRDSRPREHFVLRNTKRVVSDKLAFTQDRQKGGAEMRRPSALRKHQGREWGCPCRDGHGLGRMIGE